MANLVLLLIALVPVAVIVLALLALRARSKKGRSAWTEPGGDGPAEGPEQ